MVFYRICYHKAMVVQKAYIQVHLSKEAKRGIEAC